MLEEPHESRASIFTTFDPRVHVHDGSHGTLLDHHRGRLLRHLSACKRLGFSGRRAVLCETPACPTSALASASDSTGGERCSPKPRSGLRPPPRALQGARIQRAQSSALRNPRLPHLSACKRFGFDRRRAVLAETPVWAPPPTSRLARRSDSAGAEQCSAKPPLAPPQRLQALRIRPAASGARRNPGLIPIPSFPLGLLRASRHPRWAWRATRPAIGWRVPGRAGCLAAIGRPGRWRVFRPRRRPARRW